MEKYNEVNKKHHSDVYESKRVGVSKTNVLKKNINIPPRPNDFKNRISYVPKSKNISTSFSRKHTSFSGVTKPTFKNAEPYGLKHNANAGLLVNSVSVEHRVTEQNFEQFHNFSGNLLNVHPTLCNLTCAVPEISSFNRVLNFQPSRQNEFSFSRSARHKARPIFSELRMPNIKNSTDAFANCKYQSSSGCSIRNESSKDNSWNVASVDPYFRVPPNDNITESIACEDINLKCGFNYCTTSKDCKGIADLPILVHSNFSKQAWGVKYCFNSKVRVGNKPRKWNSKNWNKVAMLPNRMPVNTKAFEKVDKMLFPALPSNSQGQTQLNSSQTSNSVPPSENSSTDSDIESVHSFPDGNSNLSSAFITGVTATIPQASYADVIRMSSNNSSDVGLEKTSDEPLVTKVTNSISDRYSSDDTNQSAEWIVSRLSKLHQNSQGLGNTSFSQTNQIEQDSGAPHPIIVSLEKPSFYNSSLPGNKSILSLSSQNIVVCDPVGQKLNDSLMPGNSCGLNQMLPEKVPLFSETMQTICVSDLNKKGFNDYSVNSNSICSSPSSLNSLSDVIKQTGHSVYDVAYSKSNNPPVIIMNASSPANLSEISFGIDHDEMIKLCSDAPDNCTENNSPVLVPDTEECSVTQENIKPTVNKDSVKGQVNNEASQSCDATEQILEIKGKKIIWSSSNNHGNCNYKQVAEYFAKVWLELEEKGEECCEKNRDVQ